MMVKNTRTLLIKALGLVGCLVAHQIGAFYIDNMTNTEQKLLIYPLTWDANHYTGVGHLGVKMRSQGKGGAYRRSAPYVCTIAPHNTASLHLDKPPYENLDIIVVGKIFDPHTFIKQYEQQGCSINMYLLNTVTEHIDIHAPCSLNTPYQGQAIKLAVRTDWGSHIENGKSVEKTIIFLDGAWRELSMSQLYLNPSWLHGRTKQATITNVYGLRIEQHGSIAALFPKTKKLG